MPDPIRNWAFWLRPVMAITASVQPESALVVYILPDPTFRIRFSFFKNPKKAWIIPCRAIPSRIRSGWPAWSGFGQTHLVWRQAGGLESLGPVSGRTQPVRYQFPTFRIGSVLPQTSRTILCKTSPGSDLVLADCVRFCPNGSGPEASRCARIIWPGPGQCFQADPDRMWIGSGKFTGRVVMSQGFTFSSTHRQQVSLIFLPYCTLTSFKSAERSKFP